MLLNETQEVWRKKARDYVENEVKPNLIDILNSKSFMPRQYYRRMGELGFIGMMLPEERGGANAGLTEVCVVTEEMCKVAPVLGLALMCVGPNLVTLKDNEAFIRDYLEGCLSGELVFSVSATPPEGFTNGVEWQPLARRDGNDWILNGTKLFCSATVATDVQQVHGFDEDGVNRIWILDGKAEGFTHDYAENKFGMKGSGGGSNVYKNVRVADEFCIDNTNDDGVTAYVFYHMCAAVALGGAEGILQSCIDFAKEHTTSDGTPLSHVQYIASKIAEMKAWLYAANALCYDAAATFDNIDTRAEGLRMCQAAKITVPDIALRTAHECIKVFGSYGYSIPEIYHGYSDTVCAMIADAPTEFHYDVLAHSMGLYD